MRNIVLILLIANLGYFAYLMLSPPISLEPTPSLTDTRNAVRLQLVEETLTPDAAIQGIAIGTNFCGSLAGFRDSAEIAAVLERLAGEAIAASPTNDSPSSPVSHLVFMPPFSSSGVAQIMLSDILESALESDIDLAGEIIADGGLVNGIGFGEFSDEQQAVARHGLLQSLGFSAEIRSYYAVGEEAAIDLRVSNLEDFYSQTWPGLEADFPFLNWTENVC